MRVLKLEEHHARQNHDRIGRGSDCLGCNNDECIRSTKTCSTKKGHGNNTKAAVRDGHPGHSELGATNRASVRTSWWASWPSHHQTAPDDSREVANGRSTIRLAARRPFGTAPPLPAGVSTAALG